MLYIRIHGVKNGIKMLKKNIMHVIMKSYSKVFGFLNFCKYNFCRNVNEYPYFRYPSYHNYDCYL